MYHGTEEPFVVIFWDTSIRVDAELQVFVVLVSLNSNVLEKRNHPIELCAVNDIITQTSLWLDIVSEHSQSVNNGTRTWEYHSNSFAMNLAEYGTKERI